MASVAIPKRRRLSPEATQALLASEAADVDTVSDPESEPESDAQSQPESDTQSEPDTQQQQQPQQQQQQQPQQQQKQPQQTYTSKRRQRTKAFKCSACPRGYSTAHNLKGHVRSRHPELFFKCKVCHCTFIGKDALDGHECLSDVPKHECSVCGGMYLSIKSMRRHFNYAHVGIVRPRKRPGDLKCPICQRDYSTFDSLRHHLYYVHQSAPGMWGISRREFESQKQ